MVDNALPPGFSLDQTQAPENATSDPSSPPIPSGFQLDEDKYGSAPQQTLAAIEGAGQGVLGPIAPAVERSLGISPEDIRGRALANPVTHGISEAAGFAGSALVPGLGEASLAGQIGNIGEHVAATLPEATSALAKIAQTGVRVGSEMAALQTSDEISKAITEDPNQSLGSAAINIGLSGILGGGGGSALGSVSPLWKKTLNKMGVEKLASDFMGETRFLTENPDLVGGAVQEINDRIASADKLIKGGLKGDLVEKLTQDVDPEKVEKHVSEISKSIMDAPSALQNEPQFQDAVNNWKNRVTPQLDPITLQPEYSPSSSDVFKATENLKRQLQEFAEPLYSRKEISVRDMPFVRSSASMATALKESLENSSIWGAAADAQKEYNKAISPLFDIQKEFLGKFASKEMGEKVADPTKINTYLNQADKSKAGLKSNYVRNYLDQTQKAADAINSSYLENGLEQPFEQKLNPTPILDHSLGTDPTAGVSLARWAKRGGAAAMGANASGHLAGELVGGGLGFLVGHPIAGAWMGDKVLKPIFAALAKPLAEKAINAEAAKSAVEYAGNVIRGQKVLSDATSNFFKSGAEIIPKHLIPTTASRDDLKKSIDYASNPQTAMNVGGQIGHYLPDHAVAAGALSGSATSYLNSMKPKQVQNGPLDKPSPVDPSKEQQYKRQLDIAQQPLMVLKHAKNGTLQAQDVATLDALYPGLKKKMISQIYDQMVQTKTDGSLIPYKQRVSLSLLTGQPLDSTLSQPSMAGIMVANSQHQQQSTIPQQRKVSSSSARTMEKVNKMYATPEQSRAANKALAAG